MRSVFVTAVGCILVIGMFAADTVAKITSSGPFQLRGVSVKTDGVPSWPMLAGDDIQTAATPASIQFSDSSRVVLGENSRAELQANNGKLVLRLVRGSMQFKIAHRSSLTLLSNNTPVKGSSGTVAINNTPVTKPILAGRPLPPPPSSTQ